MKFSCLQENLSRGLLIVNRFVSNRPQLPVLANILISAEEGRINLKATNLETGITLHIGAKIEEKGETTVSAKTLTELVSSLPPERIDFILEKNNLKINCQKFQAILNSLSASEFPPLPTPEGKPTLSFKTEDFLLPISQVAFAAAQDESRPVLSGVKIFNQEKNLVLVATDGYRLSVKKIFQEKQSSINIILPARVLNEVVKILNEGKEEGFGLNISSEINQAIFQFSNGEIVCRALEGQFPNFEKIIPTAFSTRVVLNKGELLPAVKTVSIFARESANIIKFKIEKSKFKIEANAPQVGESEVEVEGKIEGEEGEIAFNSRFLLDYLNTIPQEEIVFEMSGPLSPGVFKPVGDETFLHIIMPVRVQE